MKKQVIAFFVLLLCFVSCKQGNVATGDLQYFELKGGVSAYKGAYPFPDGMVSYDKSGHFLLPEEPVIVNELNDPYLSDDAGPYKVITWANEQEAYYDEREGMMITPEITIIYDSKDRLVKITQGMEQEIILYDEKGRICSTYTVGEEGFSATDMTYNKDGYLERIHYYEPKEKVMEDGHLVPDLSFPSEEIPGIDIRYDNYKFDEKGNWILRRVLTKGYDGTETESAEDRSGRIVY